MTSTERVRYRSYTQLDTYLTCGAMYRYKYIERLPEQPAIWSLGGTAFHTCAEWYLTGEDMRDIESAWQQAWNEALADMVRRDPDLNTDLSTWRKANRGTEGVEWWMHHGPRMVADFIDWKNSKGKELVVLTDSERSYVEARIEVTLGDVPVLTIPDLLVIDEHGQLDIVDYKSGKNPPRGLGLQLGVYKAAALVALGLEAQWGMYYMTRQADVIAKDLSIWTPESITDLFVDFDRRESAGQYPARPGDACRFCTYKTICPEAL